MEHLIKFHNKYLTCENALMLSGDKILLEAWETIEQTLEQNGYDIRYIIERMDKNEDY